MFKDNHLTITTNLNNSLNQLKKTHANKKVQIEVDTPEQLQALFGNISIQADAVLLDNMLPEEAIKCSQVIRSKFPECFIEVSGGITLDNLLNYRDIDIDGISVGAITHQAVSKNIKLEFK
jgi:nicotinate-nucleotide pyrophosphorylase (carboxylating)